MQFGKVAAKVKFFIFKLKLVHAINVLFFILSIISISKAVH